MLFRGLKLANFLAAASIEAAAPSSSFSAITVGSSGSTQSEPVIINKVILNNCGLEMRPFSSSATATNSVTDWAICLEIGGSVCFASALFPCKIVISNSRYLCAQS